MLRQVTHSEHEDQLGEDAGGGEITGYTAGMLMSTETVRAKRWGLLIQGHTGHIFQFKSYSELRSLGISSVSPTAVNKKLWNYSLLKVVTDLATTQQTLDNGSSGCM